RHVSYGLMSSGRTFPYKWGDAERWICSPVDGDSGLRLAVQQPQRRQKSKSGPLGPTNSVYNSIYSPTVHMFVEVIEFRDSYEVPATAASTTRTATTDTTSDGTGKKKGRTVTVTTEDMQKRKNDVKARTTLLLSLPDEHQLRFSKYKTAQELWAKILKTFDGNEATKKTKKNLLKQQYGNFKAEGSETLKQTFNRLQVIVGQLQFMDVEIEQDDLNQKFLTSLALEWLMHTIVWRNRSDLDTMSLDDLYNHLKVYEYEVQKKSEPNSQNMAFISSAKHSRGNEEVNTASVSTASTNVPTASANIGKTWKKISIQRSDVAGFDKSKVECFNCHKMGHFARKCRAPRSQDKGKRDNFRQVSKVKEQASKALMAIDGVGWDWSYMANDKENHALVGDEEAHTEFALMANISAERLSQVESRLVEHKDREIKYCEKIRGLEYKTESSDEYIEIFKKELDLIKKEKEGLDNKLTGFQTASKDLDSLLESQRLDKNKEGLGYSAVPPPPAQIYSSPKKDLSWTGLPEFKDDTVTDYSRPSPTIESSSDDAQNQNPSVTEEASPSTISPKSFIKFVKANDSPTNSKTDKAERAKKPPVKYAEQYRKPTKKPNVRGNKRNWNNLKSHQLGPNFVMKKNACFNYGDFNHLAYDCRKRVKKRTSRSQNNTHKSFTPRPAVHKPYRPPVRPMRSNMNGAQPNRTSFNKPAHSYTNRPFQRTSAVRSQYRAPWVPTVNRYFPPVNRKFSTVSRNFSTVNRKFPTANRKFPIGGTKFSTADIGKKGKAIKPSASRTMLADAKLPVTFWAEAVNTACYVQNRFLVNKSQNKTPYELFNGRTPAIGFLKPFGCHVMILNSLDNLGKFEAKGDGGTNSTNLSSTKDAVRQEVKKDVSSLRYIALPNWVHDSLLESSSSKPQDDCSTDVPESSGISNPTATLTNPPANQLETLTVETPIPIVSSPVPTACFTNSPEPSNILRVTTNSIDSDGVKAGVSNMETTIIASPTPTLRIHKDHPKSHIIGPVDTPIQTRNKSKEVGEQSFIATIHQKTDPGLFEFCLFSCFLSQVEPKKIFDALQDPSWDERGIVIENKAKIVAQGHTQEEGINYDEVFAPVARIEAIRLFLAYASFMGFTVYQMDVKSVFLYGTIDEEVYVMQPPGFQDPEFPSKVYKVEKQYQTLFIRRQRGDFILVQVYVDDIIFGSSNPQLCREFEALMHEKFQMSAMGDILKKFGYSDVRSSNTPMDKENPWGKDRTGKDASVTPKECHLHAVKMNFRYLKGHPKLRLWYPKESSFDLVAYSDSDYGGATQDRKSTTRGCQFLGRRLISWQCKKQKIMATSTTEAEYVAAASCCGQVLWIESAA
nr:hypothetical protein [Tanacetum cinerariifolium]